MSITDRQRTELHRAAEESMGREPADSLMALLPPVGWADVATKHDLAEMGSRIDLRFQALDQRMATKEDLERGLKDLATKFFLGMIALAATNAAVALGIANLLT